MMLRRSGRLLNQIAYLHHRVERLTALERAQPEEPYYNKDMLHWHG